MLFQIENVNAISVAPILTLLVLDRVGRFLQAAEFFLVSWLCIFPRKRDILLSTGRIYVNISPCVSHFILYIFLAVSLSHKIGCFSSNIYPYVLVYDLYICLQQYIKSKNSIFIRFYIL